MPKLYDFLSGVLVYNLGTFGGRSLVSDGHFPLRVPLSSNLRKP